MARHQDDQDDGEIDFADGVDLSAEGLSEALEEADDPEAAGLAASTMVAVLMMWLTGAKQEANSELAGPATEWSRQQMSGDAADHAVQPAGLLGSPLAPNTTVDEAVKRLGVTRSYPRWCGSRPVWSRHRRTAMWNGSASSTPFDPEPSTD